MPAFLKVIFISYIVSTLLIFGGAALVLVSQPLCAAVMACGYVLFAATAFISCIGLIYAIATD